MAANMWTNITDHVLNTQAAFEEHMLFNSFTVDFIKLICVVSKIQAMKQINWLGKLMQHIKSLYKR